MRLVLIFLFSSQFAIALSGSANASPEVTSYIKTRDGYIKAFEKHRALTDPKIDAEQKTPRPKPLGLTNH
jgi:hypothetical protein